jgi:ABC-2 type transport system ATP-binding protein
MAIDLDRVGRRYGDREALAGVSLTISAGVTALVGVNGAGKTTLLSVASGGLRPTSGTVRLDGTDLYDRRARKGVLRRVALMPQDFGYLASFRVHDFITYLGWMRGLSWRTARRSTSAVLEQVGLGARARSRVGELSGGMLRRVALAQAIVGSPDVLLLDEPTTGLDPEQRVIIRALIGEIATDRAVIMSSHLLEDVESLASRVLVLHEGSIRFDGSIAALRALSPFADEPHAAESAFLSLISMNRGA